MGMTAGCIREIDTAQNTYIPMIVQGNQWNELHLNISVPPEYQYAHTYITKIGNDTVIDGVQYYKLLTASDSLSSDWQANGYIREDVVEQKVYYKTDNEDESLLYAFNVQVGDSFETYSYIMGKNHVTVVINNIDSVYINTMWHKRIYITSLYDSYEEKSHIWIEGIGGTDGLLGSNWAIQWTGSHPPVLSCFFNKGNLIYKPNETEDCFVWKTDFSEFWEQYNGGIIDINNFIAALMDWIKNN
jgi:hypothetical protein